MSRRESGFLENLRHRLSSIAPARPVPGQSASVAVIFRGSGRDEEILLITRAEREDDPWSGQVALPGGMVGEGDESFEETARREAKEEVGVDLMKDDFLGYMRRFNARTRDLTVVPSVFKPKSTSNVTLNQEAALYEWVRLAELAKRKARSTYLFHTGNAEIPFPSFVYRKLVIWGLTERIISSVLGIDEE